MTTLLYKLTLSFFLASAVQLIAPEARAQDTIVKESGKKIIIKSKPDGDDKITIVIDGNRVTLNGREVIDLADVKVNVGRIEREIERSVRSLGGSFQYMTNPPVPPAPPSPPAWDGKRARLGVYTENDEKGAKITKVVEGSPAGEAGLQEGDIVTAIDKKEVTNAAGLSEAIGGMQPGDEVVVKYLRNKKRHKTAVKLDSQGGWSSSYFNHIGDHITKGFKGFAETWSRPQLGLRIQDTEEGNGVSVIELDREAPAAKAGIEKNDLITEIDGAKITNTDEARRQLGAVKDKDAFRVRVQRGKATKELEIKIPRKLKTADL